MGATLIHVFALGGSIPMAHRDGIFITFPVEFELPTDGSVSASLDGT